MADEKPTLLVAKGVISRLGGAERDLLRRLTHLNNWFNVSVATLSSCEELELLCDEHDINLYKPRDSWSPPNSAISQIFDGVHRTSKQAWKNCGSLIADIAGFDYFHIISGDGYLAMLELVPNGKPAHLYLLEPHRGLHEDSLHRNLNGDLRRPKLLTSILLSKARKNDLTIVKRFGRRTNTIISGNSSYTANRIKEVYNIDCDYLHPCVDANEYTSNTNIVTNPYLNSSLMQYVVTIGRASWVKGAWETISMLAGSGLSLALVGGGEEESIDSLIKHAKSSKVGIWVAPRLESSELCSLIRRAVAVVSMAHSEPFGLTPIEAQALGTPALFVNEGGFRETIIDGFSGRLLPRDDYSAWHAALEEAKDTHNRSLWSENGRASISKVGLNPEAFSNRLQEIFRNLG